MNAKKTWQGGCAMNKDEILKKSREEKSDEGESHAMRLGAAFGLFAMPVIFCTLWLLTFVIDESKLEYLTSMKVLLFFSWGVCTLVYGINVRKKVSVVAGILFLILGILNTVTYFMWLMG